MNDRRWMYAVVTGLLLAGAARSVLAQNEAQNEAKSQPAKEASKDAGKDADKATGKEAAKQPARTAGPKEKVYVIEFRNKPWSGIFEWLTDQTDLPLISDIPAPSGTFTYIHPKGTPLRPHKATLPEVIDIINEGLLAKKFILLRRATAFTLVPADDKIPSDLVPRILVEDLDKHGLSEIVQIVYTLKTLNVDEFAPEAKKMLGNFSEVNVISRTNQLVLQDTVLNLKRLLKLVGEIEGNESNQAEMYTHECIYVRARDAEQVLRNFLGDPNQVIGVVQSGKDGGSGGSERREERDPRGGFGGPPGFGGPGFGGFGQRQPQTYQKIIKHTISSDERTNTVFVNGPPNKIALAKAVMAKLDVPGPGGQKFIPGSPTLVVYQVPAGNAVELAKALTEIHKGANLKISAVGNNQIYVHAGPEDQIVIARQIQGIRPPGASTEKIPIATLEAAPLATMLKAMFGDSKTGAPYIDAELSSNSIIVKGSTEQVDEVRTAIRTITSYGGDLGGGNLRVISLDKVSASTMADALQRILSQMRPNDVRVLVPGADPQPAPPPVPPERNLPERKSILREPRERETREQQISDEQPISYQDGAQPSQNQPSQNQPSQIGGQSKKGPPITITPIGNKLMITSDDPQALALAQELVRLIMNSHTTSGDFEVIKLKNANAVEVAKILDEVYNGPMQGGGGGGRGRGQQGGGFPFGGGGGFASLLAQGQGGGAKREDNIRVVADSATNSILVKAKMLDMIQIRNLVTRSLDTGENDSNAVISTYYIGPLKNANAVEVATVIREVYRESMNNNTRGGFAAGGISPFGGGFRGTTQRMNIDANGNPRGVTLSVGVDDRSNIIIVACPKPLYEDIKKLVENLEVAASDSKRVVKVVKVNIDPLLVEQAVNAMQGRSSTTTPGNRFSSGTTPFSGGGFGGGGFGGRGGFGGGTPGGGGITPFGGGGGFTPSFTPGGGGRTGFGGGGGGGRSGRSGRGSQQSRGPDFFGLAVKDDHQEPVLFDPTPGDQDADQRDKVVPAGARGPSTDGGTTPNAFPLTPPYVIGFQAAQPDKEPAPKEKAESVTGPRRPVIVEALPELGSVVIQAENQADLEAIIRLIEFIQRIGSGADIEFLTVPLKHADATSVVNTLNQLYQRIQISPNATTQTGARPQQPQQQLQIPGQQQPFQVPGQQQAGAVGSVVMIPLPRQNAILLATPKARTKDVLREIERLDVPSAGGGKAAAFKLKRAPAWRVASQLQTFYADRYTGEARAQNQIRITYDDYQNMVIVQASPADLDEIRSLIEAFDDLTGSAAKIELRIIPLRNAVAEDLANLVIRAISDTFVPTTGVGGQQQPGQFPGQQQGQFPGQQQQGLQQLGLNQLGALQGQTRQTKVSSLRFIVQDKDGKPIQTGILDDIRITPDARTNALIIAAPEKTMQLISALVTELDVVPNARATINIFTLKKADANQVATALQRLFLGVAAAGQQPGQFPAQQQVQPGATTQRPLQLTLGGATPEGAPIIDLRVTVDERTNSLIVAGSQNDLDIIGGVIYRLDDAKIPERRQETYRMRNALAGDVAAALNDFITKEQTNYQNSNQFTPYLTFLREVIITAEPITNSLIISATPEYFGKVMDLVMQLDTAPPQVLVQVLIAEVDLVDSNEFGVEFGLQSPVLFRRAFATGGSSFIPPGVSTSSTFNPGAFPGQNPATTLNSTVIDEGIVGFQGLGNLGVGRVSATNNIGGFVFSAGSDTFNLLIRALRVQSRIDVLSRPQVTALDGQTARVNIGQQFPIVTSTTVTATGIVQQNIDRPVIGIKLEVTPKIMPDGRVVMRVIPEVSSVVSPPIPLGNGQLSTAVNIQQVETTISAYNGETVALGGLITTKDTKVENKIPWLGDIPGLGALFRYRTQNKSKTELLIILTPHVVYSRADAERILAEESRRMDWILGDVMKVHGPTFLDGAAKLGPVTTIIDEKTPVLEQGPAPRPVMPPANGPTPGAPMQVTPMQGVSMQSVPMQGVLMQCWPTQTAPPALLSQPLVPQTIAPQSTVPQSIVPQTSALPSGGLRPIAPIPVASAPASASAAMPLTLPDQGVTPVPVAGPEPKLASRVVIQNAKDLARPRPAGAAARRETPPATANQETPLSPLSYPIQQPATPNTPGREVPR
ncbi:MAG: hypothetical protein L0Y71_00955 [Gemmataceae bacterium]|nr:hypothetical protein [Gemmataceae bacterium]